MPGSWPPLPQGGDPFWTSRPHEPFTVAEGSTLLAHSSEFDEVGTVTLFEVTDDPEVVIDRYFDQPPGPGDPGLTRRWERDGVRVTQKYWADGGTYSLRVVERPDAPTWMLLEAWPTD